MAKLRRSKILGMTPDRMYKAGYLLRGVSQDDYDKIMNQNETLRARNPGGTNNAAAVISHFTNITHTEGDPNSPYISFSTDGEKAKSFGCLLIVARAKLEGAVFRPADIIRKAKHDARVKFCVKKNTEYLLAPNKNGPAGIPPEAIVVC